MFNLSRKEAARLKASDHPLVREPELDQTAIRRMLRDKNCPVRGVAVLLALLDKPTGFQIQYTTATKRAPDCSMRRRYAKPTRDQVPNINFVTTCHKNSSPILAV